jgi:hypothetical protein
MELHDVLNIVFLAVAAVLGARFLRTGGIEMVRMMNAPSGSVSRTEPEAAQNQHPHHVSHE